MKTKLWLATSMLAITFAAAPALRADTIMEQPAVPVQVVTPSSVQQVVTPSTVQQVVTPASVRQVVGPSTTTQVVGPSTVQQVVTPGTMQVVPTVTMDGRVENVTTMTPSTVQNVVTPGAVQNVVTPGTVQNVVVPGTVQNLISPTVQVMPVPVANTHWTATGETIMFSEGAALGSNMDGTVYVHQSFPGRNLFWNRNRERWCYQDATSSSGWRFVPEGIHIPRPN